MPGLFIAFEGTLSAGKKTHSKLLSEKLREMNKEVVLISFPSYETEIGKLIKGWISRSLKLTSEAASMLYAANRMQYQQRIKEWLNKGWIVIVDRYCYSNIAYQTVLGLSKQWLIDIENPIIKPDVIFLLDVPAKEASERGLRQENLSTFLDMEEVKPEETFREKVRKEFLELSKNPPYGKKWHVIDGTRPVEVVNDEIWGIVQTMG
jgi:dTMP kinase